MTTVWFVVAFMFASDAHGIAPSAEIPNQVSETSKGEAIQKPISMFQNWGPAFSTKKSCATWAASHVTLIQGMRAGCASVQVAEVGK